jgi:predicted membrane GTPase involved in stress response
VHDEWVEVTSESILLRKKILKQSDRRDAANR